MRLLLDTHVALWWRQDSRALRADVKRRIAQANEVHVSAASAWEVALKTTIGRIRLDVNFSEQVRDSGFDELPVTFEHVDQLQELPPHHADPFDRMLVAQAQKEGLTLVTHDRQLEPYQVAIIWT